MIEAQSGKEISKSTLAQRARLERERLLKQSTAQLLEQRLPSGKENSQPQVGKEISKSTLAQCARRERERILKQSTTRRSEQHLLGDTRTQPLHEINIGAVRDEHYANIGNNVRIREDTQRADTTAQARQKSSYANKGKGLLTYAKEKDTSLVEPLRDRNVGVEIHEERNVNIIRVREVGTNPQEVVHLPSTIGRCQHLNELLSRVYPQLDVANTSTPTFLTERTILSAQNDDVNAINGTALNIFPGNRYTYLAADKMSEDDGMDRSITNQYPNEYLNSLDPTGLPPFKLELKVGCPIILLRNIAPKDGLCNCIRMMVVRCGSRIIDVKILTGEQFGKLAFIPRISLSPSSSDFSFHMTRRQFPVRLAYAMTINKSQGQSVKFVGVDLRTPVFSHGQLYVALSRCTSFDHITVLLPEEETDSTTNIVYPEVLL
ncbi:hypothetical protein RHGRI_030911 [Rhododendron griersonianum]|uniref:DNA helicase Pif1-like 2B domain-containing protein n=1 Tax=Rhododendron griersonianum TaxID=479676 RepID=A0AAV6IAH1_9ERIC|nr:hypothetical protein RHGRI_030911 [Rhododendron griersonianum]